MDDEITIFTPYACVIPGVDSYLALKLRTRAEQCLAESECEDGYVEANPHLVAAILMDEAYEFTNEARLN